MIWAFRGAMIVAAVIIYLTAFQPLEGYWPLLGLALCAGGYVLVTSVLETRFRSLR